MATTASAERVTIYDVAHRAGVSKSLVSLVLRGSPQVSPARREAVQRAIDELGYRPSRAAAALAGQRTNTIGVVIDDFANLWFVELLAGLREGLAGTPFHVGVADAALNAHLSESPVHGYLAARVDGLVIAAEPQETDAAGVGVPTVLVGNRRRGVAGADRVAADEAAGARIAVEHLVGLGHRRIAFAYTGVDKWRALGDFWFEGITRAAAAGGLPPVASAAVTVDNAAEVVTGWHRDGVTAVCGQSDEIACLVLHGIRAAGLRCPADLAVMGVDAGPAGAIASPPLTTVEFDPGAVADAALAAVRGELGYPSPTPPTPTDIARLVLRESA